MPTVTVILPRRRPEAGAALTNRWALDWAVAPWRNRRFLDALVRRDLGARYRGSVLGLTWLVVLPLAMMATYSLVFGGVLRVRFDAPAGGRWGTVLSIWAGTFVWQVLAESVGRSVGILHDNAPYVKRVPFPLFLLPLMPLGTALVGASVSLGLFAAAYLAMAGMPPATWLLLPTVACPAILLAAAACWTLAAMGAFLRDLKHVVPLGLTLLMFLTPVLYPLSAVPTGLAPYVGLNPLAYVFEYLRAVLVEGRAPPLAGLAALNLGACLAAMGGYALFRLREWEYADVV